VQGSTTVVHSWTKRLRTALQNYSGYKTLSQVSLQAVERETTSHRYWQVFTGCRSPRQLMTKSPYWHLSRWQQNSLPICTSCFRYISQHEYCDRVNRSIAYKQLLRVRRPSAVERSVVQQQQSKTLYQANWRTNGFQFYLLNVKLKLTCSDDHMVANARWPEPAICHFIVTDIWRVTICVMIIIIIL
jgi:hypothetical protein